ncbi:MAG: helix-turn-helix domain-containing protein [Chloroflexota bacterium]|nr:helix-turn-helix domain-containing protein [Chloroflexota bacterium]
MKGIADGITFVTLPRSIEVGAEGDSCDSRNVEIGEAIRRSRKAYDEGRGMTQEVLAERIGVSRDYLARIECGKHPEPSLGLVLLIARGLELKDAAANQLLLECGHDKLPELRPVPRG